MTYQTNKNYIVVCEGEKSEKAYIQELNKYFEKHGFGIVINYKSSNTGNYNAVIKKYKEIRTHNRNSGDCIFIWVDKDRYIRNDSGDGDKYRTKHKNIPDFNFNYMNYEDFLVMHLDDDTFKGWCKICRDEKHDTNPMPEAQYEPLFKNNIFSEYDKNELPSEMKPITKAMLDNLFKHNEDKNYFIRSDFADFIKDNLLKSGRCDA